MIPKKFKLGSVDFKVQNIDNIDDTGLGRAISHLGLIRIAEKWHGNIIPEDCIEKTFYHELIHVILDCIGEKELSDNERFVESFSTLLHQFEVTKK